MLTLARTLSVLSVVFTVVFTVVVIGAGRLHLLQLGFEGLGFAVFWSGTPAALAALLALLIATVRLRFGTRVGFAEIALTSAISLLVLGFVAVMGDG